MTFEENKKLIENIAKYIKNNEIKNVVLSSLWNYFLVGVSHGVSKKFLIEKDVPGVYGEDPAIPGDMVFETQFIKTIKMIRATGANIWIIAPIPEIDVQPKQFVNSLEKIGLNPNQYSHSMKEYHARSKKFYSVISKISSDVRIINPTDDLCSFEKCPLLKNGRLLYSDESHLTTYGALQLKKSLLPLRMEVLKNKVQ